MTENIPEILAPAGSFESLETALKCGADAVYIGGKYFSARGNAQNFSNEEIEKACRLCHLYNAKLYLAVNTIITDDETVSFCEYIKFTASAGTDAYIVQDWGALYLIKKCVPNAVIHASTQMTIHTPDGAEFAKSLGFSRVVPAREVSFSQINEICKHIPETEIFIHGALCMSVSGQCYMSAVIGTRSANRGVCGQACRLPFSSCGNKNFCALSLKDLSLLCYIQKLKQAGITSFKIEGRMKRPEYIAAAVTETKKALGGKTPDMKLLKNVFSRSGFTDGYFTGKRNEMFGIRTKNDVISARDVLPDIREYYRKQPLIYNLKFYISVKKNQPVYIKAYCTEYDLFAEVRGDIPQTALKKSIDLNYAEKQLSKLGGTVFIYNGISGDIDDNLTISASSLNTLRREAVQKIQEQIIKKNTPVYQITEYVPEINKNIYNPQKPKIYFQCVSIIQAKTAEPYADMLIIPLDECQKAAKSGINIGKICIAPPRFITDENKIKDKLKNLHELGIDNILCTNPAYIKIGKNLDFTLHGGFGLNAANSFSCRTLSDCGLSDITLSFELKLSQLKKINSPVPTGIIAYGKLPLMLTRNCPIKNETGCSKCKKFISDRTGRKFPVRCNSDYTEILNTDTLYLDNKEFSGFDFIIIMLNDENQNQVRYIAENFGSPDFKPVSPTKGLYYRGVSNETKN